MISNYLLPTRLLLLVVDFCTPRS